MGFDFSMDEMLRHCSFLNWGVTRPNYRNGPKWTKMDQNGPKWTKMGPKWTKMDRNGPKWDGSKLCCTSLYDPPKFFLLHFKFGQVDMLAYTISEPSLKTLHPQVLTLVP